MVGSPPRNYWVDDGEVTENPPSHLLDQRGRWILSPGGPVANTMAYLRPACEANRESRDNGSNPMIPLEIATASHRGQLPAPVPESESTRQRDRMSQPRKLRTLLPRPRPVADAGDVRATSRPHQPPPAQSQLPPHSSLHSGTQRENTVGKSFAFVSYRCTTATQVHNMTTGLRHPMVFATPQVRHMTAVPHSTSVRPTGPRVGSMTPVRQPTPTLAPLAAFRCDNSAQVHRRTAVSQHSSSFAPLAASNRGTYGQVGNTTRRFEYPSPPPQSSYYTAGIDPAPHRHGQVRTFPGPYYINREQAYRANQGRSSNWPVLNAEREHTLTYSESTPLFLDVSCEQCGSHNHFTAECPYLPEPQ